MNGMKKQRNYLFYIFDYLCMLILIGFDQFTKSLAIERLKNQNYFSIIDDVLQLRYLENKGAAFGMLQNKKIFFVIIGIIILIVIAVFLVKIPVSKKYRALRVCLVLLSAGAVGNMIDRVIYGYVIDFIYVVYINFPIFNAADCYVTVSTILLAILILFVYKEDDLDLKKSRTPKIHSSLRNSESLQNKEENK